MQTEKKFAKLAVLAFVATLLLTLRMLGRAETETARAIRSSAATTPTNVPGIEAYAEPPKGFNPVTATDEELAAYGFPPRPDKQANPDQHAEWERAMKLARITWNGKLKTVPGSERRITPAASSALPGVAEPETGPQQMLNTYASGVIVTSGQKTYNKNSINDVVAEITVPTVEFPLDATVPCTGQGYVAISAVGIDGFVFNTGNGYGYDPQLEAGVYEQVSCSGDLYYFAVVGWQGGYNVAFNVNPGDVIYASAYTTGGSNSGVYLEDMTTAVHGSYSVTSSGIVGRFANWVVERQCCSDNQPLPLANTTNIAFGSGIAYNENGKSFYPGSQATTTQVLNMTDDADNETIEQILQGSTGYQGQRSLWFDTTNCAAVGGCTP